jgi:hypothetical protein
VTGFSLAAAPEAPLVCLNVRAGMIAFGPGRHDFLGNFLARRLLDRFDRRPSAAAAFLSPRLDAR